ncbi:ion transporter [Hahella sp. CCB-MM4]|uniref:potassium channel family protein n=1 Tax=Hahella sp. (strain CCB-MM4) TaxID=1926491 RepID=UPI000B9AC4EE|nr:potassium channel family protein [Hahella sp. CCB-MM4]OZG71960.1 ion transporter [Hahella sp. CCB-MM4]
MTTHDHISQIFGLAGVDIRENAKAKRWAGYLEWPMILVALWIIVSWYLEAGHHLTKAVIGLTDWIVWLFFLAETIILASLVDKKLNYLKRNWINLVIIIFGFPLIWWYFPFTGALRTLRILAMLGLFLQISKTTRKLLSQHNLGTTLALGFIMIIMAGFIVAGIEPSIDTPMDGIWWALVTMSTVGYGDIVPESTAGRLFASILIIIGLGMISVLTASFAAFFLSEEEGQLRRKENEILRKINHLEDELAEMRTLLEEVAGRKTPPTQPTSRKRSKKKEPD